MSCGSNKVLFLRQKFQLEESLVILRVSVWSWNSGQKHGSYNGEALRVYGVSGVFYKLRCILKKRYLSKKR